jgi:hypothetical protein
VLTTRNGSFAFRGIVAEAILPDDEGYTFSDITCFSGPDDYDFKFCLKTKIEDAASELVRVDSKGNRMRTTHMLRYNAPEFPGAHAPFLSALY